MAKVPIETYRHGEVIETAEAQLADAPVKTGAPTSAMWAGEWRGNTTVEPRHNLLVLLTCITQPCAEAE